MNSTRWTTAIAAAALIGLPAAGFAQTSASIQPPKARTAAQAPQTTATSAADHAREAMQAFESIPQSSVPAADRAKFAQLRRHLNALERDVATASPSATAKSTAAPAKAASWSTEVAAIDKLLTDLIGPDSAAAGTPEPATPATPPTAGTSGRSSSAARAATLDDTTKDKLREVRRHITELASAMSGTSSPKNEDQPAGVSTSASNPDTMGSSSSAAQAAAGSPAQTAAGSSTMSSTEPPATGAPQSASASAQAGQMNPGQTAAATAAQQPRVDAAAAKQHLSEARESLSQLTALPEATRLQGETRVQVSQLISNFNELITTQADWKAAYGKVTADLNALLGPEGSDESNMPTATSASATGAVGTTGTTGAAATAGTTGTQNMQLDPAIKTKLQEVRAHLREFALAAGGAPGAENAAAPSASIPPSATASSTTNPANPPMSPDQALPTSPTSTANPAAPPAAPTPTPNPTTPPTSASGSAAAAAATGTAGSTSPAAPEPQTAAAPSAAAGHAQADRHLDAISEILTRASKDGRASLEKAELDQLKMHLDQLRQLLKEGERKDK